MWPLATCLITLPFSQQQQNEQCHWFVFVSAHACMCLFVCISSMFAHLNANAKWDDGLTLACRKMTINFNIVCLLNDCQSGPCRFFFSSPLYHSGILFSFSVLKRSGQQTKKCELGLMWCTVSFIHYFFLLLLPLFLHSFISCRKREGEVFFVLDYFFCMTSVGKREFRPIVTHIRRNDNDKGKTFFFFFYFSWS